MKLPPHLRRWALSSLLLMVATLAGACGLGEEGTPRQSTPTEERAPAASTAGSDAGASPEKPSHGHLEYGTVRCASCHTEADRANPKWKEAAKKAGHDVQRALRDRSTCNCCHLGEVRGFGQPLDKVCVQCHEGVKVAITKMGAAHCLSCHDPSANAGATIRQSAWECRKCHSKDQENRPAIEVHGGPGCENCHRPHSEPWTVARHCTDCHTGHETRHGHAAVVLAKLDGGAGSKMELPAPGDPAECQVCHKHHERAGGVSDRCIECHNQQTPEAFNKATFPSGHERCTTCHLPHDAAQAGPKPCRTCHDKLITMQGRGAATHANCLNCHKQHNVKESAPLACAGCHTQVHPNHPDNAGRGCIGCHKPHPSARDLSAIAAGFGAPGAKPPTRVECVACHTQAETNASFHAGGTNCVGCHTPHSFTKATVAPCGSCHVSESAAAQNPHGHKNCTTCHVPHKPTDPKPACSSCHTVEASTAPPGHADCRKCHDAHPGSRVPKAACLGCHADRKAGPHSAVQCSSCHAPHQATSPAVMSAPAARPACTTCHDASKLPGVHQNSGHATCTSCHGAHKPPSSERKVCVSCHTNRKDHEPTATQCKGCHAFGKAR